ncbi:Sulfatase-like protein [Globisporangium polare]
MVQLSGALARAREYAYYALWSSALYVPLFAYPLYSRWLNIVRNAELLGVSSVAKGSVFGFFQDLAICFQTLIIVRLALFVKRALDRFRDQHRARANGQYLLVAMQEAEREHEREMSLIVVVSRALLLFLGRVFVVSTLVLAFLWASLAVLADFCLLITFHPRLNRGFVEMYVMFADQFMASVFNPEVLTPSVVCGLASYVFSLAWWTFGLAQDKIALPEFDPLFCFRRNNPAPSSRSSASEPSSSSIPSTPRAHSASEPQQRKSEQTAMAWFFGALSSLTFRYLFLSVTVYMTALQTTIAFDGNGNDIYLLSNAMFSLQMENYLRPPDSANTLALLLSEDDHFASIRQAVGPNENFQVENSTLANFPYWRKTVAFSGEKRFDIVPPSNTTAPGAFNPDILFINLESWRANYVGCIGGAPLKAQFNQTPTPFFDEISKSGVLFRNHYTPSLQTSRTLMTTLYGIMPFFSDGSAVRDIKATKLRLRGIQNLLKDLRGYVTGFWSAVSFTWEDWAGFFKTHGFDLRVDQDGIMEYLTEEQKAGYGDDYRFSWGRHDPVSFDALENFLETHKAKQGADRKPLFLDIYTITSHDPWAVPADFVPDNITALFTKHNTKYLTAMNMADRALGKFIGNLRTKGLMKNTILIIEGDHGYGRMEHNGNMDIVSSHVYEEASHIPLMIVADDFIPEHEKGTTVDDITSQTDILATIADMVRLENFLQHGIGHSLLRKEKERAVVLENPFTRGTKGVRVGELKYAFYGSGEYEIFNITSDPGEHAPIEKGKTAWIKSSGSSESKWVKDDARRTLLEFAETIVDTSTFMYKNNGFMP